MSEHTVILRNVSKIYRQNSLAVTALTDINLDIPKKDFACLSGPSGSGKSTLLNLIGGLDQPTTGEITVDGQRVDQLGKSELAQLRHEGARQRLGEPLGRRTGLQARQGLVRRLARRAAVEDAELHSPVSRPRLVRRPIPAPRHQPERKGGGPPATGSVWWSRNCRGPRLPCSAR